MWKLTRNKYPAPIEYDFNYTLWFNRLRYLLWGMVRLRGFIRDTHSWHSYELASLLFDVPSPQRFEQGKNTKIKQYFNQPAKNFGNTAVADLQNSWYITRPSTRMGQFYDFLPGRVGKWSTANENATQLVHPAVTWNNMNRQKDNLFQ